ncbi:MAG TPA: phosphate ABC transporter permease subunit PstC, partial [Agromyces sp.]|nr:phosphate ABC transporter permease subunit PstC [Agromyces sp.]
MTTATAPIRAKQRPGDRVFSKSAVFAGSMILVTLAAVATFLVVQSIPALFADREEASILDSSFWAYVGPLVFGTVWAAALALVIALPI